MKTHKEEILGTNFNHVSVQTSESLNNPVLVIDYSKPIVETFIEEVEVLKPEMKVISERYNPFFKKTVYKIEITAVTDYYLVAYFYDYAKAVKTAKEYAKKNNLKYI